MSAAFGAMINASSATEVDLSVDQLRAFRTLVEMCALLGGCDGEISMMRNLPVIQQDDSSSSSSISSRINKKQNQSQLLVEQYDPEESVADWSKRINASSVQTNPMMTTAVAPPVALPLSANDDDETDENNQSATIRFQSTVSIVEIPSHRDMSYKSEEQIWADRRTILKRGKQNSLEWYADGKDWRRVATEEDGMVWSQADKQYIHPFTWQQQQNSRRQQDLERRRQAAIREQRSWIGSLEREYAQHHGYEYCL